MTTRAQIIAEAASWLGTPFHNRAWKKGGGVDCAMFLRCVAVNAGAIEEFEVEDYSAQWCFHRDEPRFLNVLSRYAEPITKAELRPADIIMYNFGRHAAHGAFVVNDVRIIHAYSHVGRVTYSDRREIESREHSYHRIRGITE